jgi:hypothetical protein
MARGGSRRFAGHFLDASSQPAPRPIGRAAQRPHHIGVGPPKLDGLVPGYLARTLHVEPEVSRRNERGAAAFTYERMLDPKLLLDPLDLGAGLT